LCGARSPPEYRDDLLADLKLPLRSVEQGLQILIAGPLLLGVECSGVVVRFYSFVGIHKARCLADGELFLCREPSEWAVGHPWKERHVVY
jgi:hypothetical protein